MTLSNLNTNKLLPQYIPVLPYGDFSNTATGTYSSSGLSYKYIQYTASSTFTVSTAGYFDALIIAGGGGGGGHDGGSSGGGGAGGTINRSIYLPTGTWTVTIGGGGAGGVYSSNSGLGSNGSNSLVADYIAWGGGYGGADYAFSGTATGAPNSGGSGGGSAPGGDIKSPGAALYDGSQGFIGGTQAQGGGGGGAGAATTGSGAGGAGLSSSITNSAVTYAVGGFGNGTTVNTAYGSGGRGSQGLTGGSGLAGIVILRVRTA